MTITTTVGDTYRFAIELLFDDFYDDDFVASGSFRMFVNGFPYGYQGACATTYYMIVVGLRKLSEENIIRRNIFNQYSDLDIATNYREARFEQSSTTPARPISAWTGAVIWNTATI